ncbi:MAG: phosphate regulon transcriptional regulator PhoB [Xanthomonadales bacterium]|nr:phosphate regulon transcriptional regulator PhoB [Gammaproteobacteria bacterium]NNK04442.1 phosphate regulon transcriptional regulator PhoB [Xanthomonadales bacterium]
MIRFALSKSGMKVRCAANGREALEKINDKLPDIILLDWMMPKMSGPELIRRLKKNQVTSTVPIIMLTARVSEDDKVTGLNVGADDYIIKPFSPRELVARIGAVLRRSDAGDADGKITAGSITMDTQSRQVFLAGKAAHVGPTEYRLLEFFITHENRSFSRSQLLDHVWGTNVFLEERTVDVHIRRLRKILQKTDLQHYIQTVRGHGYRFAVTDAE